MADNGLEQVHEALLQLQDVLKQKFALVSEIEDLPKNLQGEQDRLENEKKALADLQTAYATAVQESKDNAIKYDDAVTDRTNGEKQMDSITTQREYEALAKQIEEAKLREGALLKARTASQALVADIKAKLDAEQLLVDDISATVAEKSAQIDANVKAKTAEIEELDLQCKEIKGTVISDDLYAKFSNIVQNKKGVGIVPIHGQVCQGCNMILPVQFVNDVRMENSTEYCPYCSRILYYEESEDAIDLSHIEIPTDNEDKGTDLSDFVSSSDFDDVGI